MLTSCVTPFLGGQNIKHGIQGHAVDWYADVFDLIFPGVDVEAANALWDRQLREPEKEKRKRKVKSSKSSAEEEDSDDD
jgi:ATP-dependent Lon protease